MSFEDHQLTAYLAGEADPTLAEEIETALMEDPVLEDRLLQLDPLSAPVSQAFEVIEPVNLPNVPETKALRGHPWYRATAAIVIMVLGAGAVSLMVPDHSDWHRQVAAYQALYVPETITALEPSDAALEAQFDAASAALGVTLAPAVFGDVGDVDLKRAQILGYQGRPLIQIVYSDAVGNPVALCIMRQAGSEARAPTSVKLKGLPAEIWNDGALEYILIGGTNARSLAIVGAEIRDLL
ncbi:MAG: hypothetical protein MK098_13005 [Marinovum sp.]|nr:hypothetical protein [Marinovum sp.]